METPRILDLSMLDQVAHRSYIRLIYVLPYPDSSRSAEVLDCLRNGIRATIQRWPFLGDEVYPWKVKFIGQPNNLVEVRESGEPHDTDDTNILRVKYMTSPDVFPHSFAKLKQDGFPPVLFDGKLLCPLGPDDRTGQTWPVMGVQANFIQGGLLLGFSIDHTVIEEVGAQTIMNYMSQATQPGFQASKKCMYFAEHTQFEAY
jgi:trichothecene 3-O-acetyltransferase